MPRAGQCLSDKAIVQMKRSKIETMKKKYNWDIVNSYLDTNINISSRNRQLKFITLREFKKLIEEGNSLKDIKKMGISKHLLQFFSSLLQEKIKLTQDKFIEEYEKGLSLEDLCKKYEISKDNITFLRQLYKVKSRGATFIKRKNTEVSLTKEQKEIIYGGLMGDAKKMSLSSVAFGHGENQKDYLLWKYKKLENVASPTSLKIDINLDKRTEFRFQTWKFYTYANTDIEKIIMQFYNNGKKGITDEILSNLTPLSVAIWYMDDGHTDFGHRQKIRNNWNNKPLCYFCTESFTKEECEKIIEWFKNTYNINSYLYKKNCSNGDCYQVRIKAESAYHFLDLITPYILPMFKYKVNYNKYLTKRQNEELGMLGEELFQCPLGADFSNLSLEKQDKYVDCFVGYFQKNGIQSLVKDPLYWKEHINYVINYNTSNLMKDNSISFSHIGNRFLMAHFINFWSAKSKGSMSPKEIFTNKKYLSEIIRKIIQEKKFPDEELVLRKLQRYRGNKSISGFMPCVAKAIFDKYCDSNSKVIDFCAGYGGRLFGAFSSDQVDSYTGIEINFLTYMGLNELYKNLKLYTEIKKDFQILNVDSLNGMKQFKDQFFDFCFTSPPYFDTEEYSDEINQSSITYSNYNQWFNKFLIESIIEAKRISKKTAININNTGGYKIADDLENYLLFNNIKYIVDYIKLPRFGGGYKLDPIFII